MELTNLGWPGVIYIGYMSQVNIIRVRSFPNSHAVLCYIRKQCTQYTKRAYSSLLRDFGQCEHPNIRTCNKHMLVMLKVNVNMSVLASYTRENEHNYIPAY